MEYTYVFGTSLGGKNASLTEQCNHAPEIKNILKVVSC